MSIIKSISYDQTEIIKNIIELHIPEGFIELDPTYSTGRFYKDIPQPKFKFDLDPITEGVYKSDCRELPFAENSISSIIFDPPFIVGYNKSGEASSLMAAYRNFGAYKTIKLLWDMYINALLEFYYILKPNGILIFKCQDTISCGKQYFSEYKIIKEALKIGFYPKDKFILLSKSRPIGATGYNQHHTRKFHSYFLIFIKQNCTVRY